MAPLTSLGLFISYECIIYSFKRLEDKKIYAIQKQLSAKASPVRVGTQTLSPEDAQKLLNHSQHTSNFLKKISLTQIALEQLKSSK